MAVPGGHGTYRTPTGMTSNRNGKPPDVALAIPEWHDQALCRQFPESLKDQTNPWLSNGTNAQRRAKQVCTECPVRKLCFIENYDEEFHVWGGCMPSERRALHKATDDPEAAWKQFTGTRARRSARRPARKPSEKFKGSFTMAEVQTILSMRRKGATIREIRDELRCNVNTLEQWLKRSTMAGRRSDRLVQKCRNGHDYTEENTLWEKRYDGKGDGRQRRCRTCRNRSLRSRPSKNSKDRAG